MKRAELISAIAEAYGLRVLDVLAVQKGYRNESHVLKTESGFVNLILYKTEPGILTRINNADATAQLLAVHGLPVRAQLSPRIIKLTSGERVQYGGLYNYLPGATISWEAYTKDHLRSIGLTMALMHNVLRETSDTSRASFPLVIDECSQIAERMGTYFSQDGVQRALREKLKLQPLQALHRYKRLFEKIKSTPDQHLLHMDFVRGNVLFSPSTAASKYGYGKVQVSGIIDFEKTAHGLPVFDVARTLAFLLVDTKYKHETEVRRYFLDSGYNKHGGGKLTIHQNIAGKNMNILEILVDFFLSHDLYKFLLHNPYEHLPSNEHFMRTVALLKQRGKLAEI